MCARLGATLATVNQLTAAWEAGMHSCFCGYLQGALVRYPVNKNTAECASDVAVARCPSDFKLHHANGWDAYCFMEN